MNLMIKSNRLYDTLKFIAQIALPGAGTLYAGLAQIWHLPNAEQVVSTTIALDAFLGLFLRQSSNAYDKSDAKFDGEMEVNPNTGTASLSSDDIAAAVEAGKSEVTLKVKKVPHKKPAKKASKRIEVEAPEVR